MRTLDCLKIVIEPNVVYSQDAERSMIRDLRVTLHAGGEIMTYTQLYREDIIMSQFDQIFDEAKRRIKLALEEGVVE